MRAGHVRSERSTVVRRRSSVQRPGAVRLARREGAVRLGEQVRDGVTQRGHVVQRRERGR
ncbi:hypothetical protein [Cellulosimicrobium sp. CpK407]|uniref:hypothetical protein n=1 Tax=Cellulosimicrobium sp. CpK407 TaxID=3229847 RepID=UPI003F3EFB53